MMEQDFQRVYEKFKLQFFRRLFSQVREREGSLSAMEAFSVEVIHQLNAPTIGRFADFLGISQSNATYKVNNLVAKGYVRKVVPDTDRREVRLETAEKFTRYFTEDRGALGEAVGALQKQYSQEEIELTARVIDSLVAAIEEEEG